MLYESSNNTISIDSGVSGTYYLAHTVSYESDYSTWSFERAVEVKINAKSNGNGY